MVPEPSHIGLSYACAICDVRVNDRTDLIEHLRVDHEILEVVSYAAATMSLDQERDRVAKQFHVRFEHLKRELAGH